MAEDRMAVLETVRKAMAEGDVDFLREGVRVLAQAVMEAEVSELTGVPHGERNPEQRLTNRNGYRERRWDTRVGTIGLAIPKVRDGSYYPSLLEPRRRAERALLAVVQEAYVLGVSTRRVEDLVEALGIASLSKSEVSRICAALDAEVETFRHRSLAAERYPYLWLDATYVKVRDGGRVVSMAALVASGVASSGERRILGLELSPGNDEGSAWPAFIRSLVERGLEGVRLVISDSHRGLVVAVRERLLGAAWQRSSVHSGPGPLVPVSHRAESALAAAIGLEILRQTRASARKASLHRPEGDVPRAPNDERPGWVRRAARRDVTARRAASWRSSSGSIGASSITKSMPSTLGTGRPSRCGYRTIAPGWSGFESPWPDSASQPRSVSRSSGARACSSTTSSPGVIRSTRSTRRSPPGPGRAIAPRR
jgi:transposase-like protein